MNEIKDKCMTIIGKVFGNIYSDYDLENDKHAMKLLSKLTENYVSRVNESTFIDKFKSRYQDYSGNSGHIYFTFAAHADILNRKILFKKGTPQCFMYISNDSKVIDIYVTEGRD